ncbi:GNAT family N-acetyltransferase [Actinoplanes sp. NPDC000266]
MPSTYPPLNLAVHTPRLTLAAAARGRGLGKESRAAILHLAFEGFGAREAGSDAFTDDHASNRVSESLGYTRNGSDWATRRGEPAELQRWRLTRAAWTPRRRPDITLTGVEECKPALGL